MIQATYDSKWFSARIWQVGIHEYCETGEETREIEYRTKDPTVHRRSNVLGGQQTSLQSALSKGAGLPNDVTCLGKLRYRKRQ